MAPWILLAFLLQGAPEQWKRHFDIVDMRNDARFAFPAAHPMAYFLVDRCLRSDPADRFDCSPNPTPEALQWARSGWTELRFVGHVGAFGVYDLFHRSPAFPAPYLRSVLLSESTDRVHEIYVQGGFSTGEYFPTEILKVGDLTILRTAYDDHSLYSPLWERFFLATGKGTTVLDFSRVFDAAKKVAPSGLAVFDKTREFDWTSLTYKVQVMKGSSRMNCCDGRIEVPFSVQQNGTVVAGPATYFPD